MELISIVVPVHNTEKFIRDTISSVLNQTIDNYELILVNDASTDNTLSILKEYENNKRIKIIDLKDNVGAAEARNIGIKSSIGNYLCFLDADDYWNPNKLEKQINFMKEKACAFSFTGYEFADSNLNPLNKKVRVPKTLNYNQLLRNTTIFTSTVMFNLNKINDDMIKFPIVKSEDTALWLSILKNNYIAYGLNENLVYYRRSESTLSSNKIEAIKRIWNLYRNVENLSLIRSIYNFIFYAFNAVRRRI